MTGGDNGTGGGEVTGLDEESYTVDGRSSSMLANV